MSMDTVKPDGRGRIPLARYADALADQYLVKVNGRGVITLVPATVRASVIDELEAANADFVDDLAAAVEGGADGSPFWESFRSRRPDP